MKKIILFGFLGLSVSLMVSCGGEEVAKKTYDYARVDSLPPDYTTSLGNIRVSIEDASVLNKLLKNNGYAYNSAYINPASKSGNYSNTKMQALNLGAYGSDLNYALSFEQPQDLMNDMKSVMELSKKLGIEKAFNSEMMQKLTNAADTATDKSILLTRAYRFAQDELQSNERAALVSLMVVGGWVETLYIYTSNLKTKPGSGEINMKVWEHVMTYKDAIKMLTVWKNNGNKDCEEVLNDMNTINGTMQDIIRTQGDIKPNQMEILHNALVTVRTKITG